MHVLYMPQRAANRYPATPSALSQATDSLRENWGEYMTECTFNWRMLKTIFTELHVYDKETNYKPFDWRKEEPLFALQRQILPNSN